MAADRANVLPRALAKVASMLCIGMSCRCCGDAEQAQNVIRCFLMGGLMHVETAMAGSHSAAQAA